MCESTSKFSSLVMGTEKDIQRVYLQIVSGRCLIYFWPNKILQSFLKADTTPYGSTKAVYNYAYDKESHITCDQEYGRSRRHTTTRLEKSFFPPSILFTFIRSRFVTIPVGYQKVLRTFLISAVKLFFFQSCVLKLIDFFSPDAASEFWKYVFCLFSDKGTKASLLA